MKVPCVLQDFVPFGVAAQKGDWPIDRPTDRPTVQQTKLSVESRSTWLKRARKEGWTSEIAKSDHIQKSPLVDQSYVMWILRHGNRTLEWKRGRGNTRWFSSILQGLIHSERFKFPCLQQKAFEGREVVQCFGLLNWILNFAFFLQSTYSNVNFSAILCIFMWIFSAI